MAFSCDVCRGSWPDREKRGGGEGSEGERGWLVGAAALLQQVPPEFPATLLLSLIAPPSSLITFLL